MAVGGGENGNYVTYATFDNQHFHTLLNPSNPSGIITLVIGGQKGEYAANECVDLNMVLKAARKFAETGKLDETVLWSEP